MDTSDNFKLMMPTIVKISQISHHPIYITRTLPTTAALYIFRSMMDKSAFAFLLPSNHNPFACQEAPFLTTERILPGMKGGNPILLSDPLNAIARTKCNDQPPDEEVFLHFPRRSPDSFSFFSSLPCPWVVVKIEWALR